MSRPDRAAAMTLGAPLPILAHLHQAARTPLLGEPSMAVQRRSARASPGRYFTTTFT